MAEDLSVPGTVQLMDLEGVLRAKYASGSQGDVVLVPAPSDDPDDPLNWSTRRKWISTASISTYTFAIGIASAAAYSVLEPIEKSTSLTLNDLNAGTGYMFLLFGWGCLFWQPLALQYGKRPVCLISALATTVIMIWVPYIGTNGQYIANKLLQGFFGAPVESLCEILVTDIYFTHERGTYIAVYGFFLGASNYLAPLFAGFINEGQGWKWVFYWCALLSGFSFVFLLLFMEETNYRRHRLMHNEVKGGGSADSRPLEHSLRSGSFKAIQFQPQQAGSAIAAEETRTDQLPKKKSFSDRLKVFRKQDLGYPNGLKRMIMRPLIFLSFPVISYAGFSYGSNIVWFNVLNGTASLILSGKPYAFAPSIIGLSYIAPFLGMTLGSIYTGPIGTWLVLRMGRRNRGIMQSEYRLWLFSPSVLLLPTSLILWGVGAAHHVYWFGLVFAMGLIGYTTSVGLQLSISYCIDSYRDLSGEALVTVILIRNTMSFAIGYGITPWVTDMGLQNAFIVATFAGLAQVLTAFVFIRYGQNLRKASISKYQRYVEEMKAGGLVQ